MEISHVAVWGSAVLSMVLGFVWYGPLFGQKWKEIIGAGEMDAERMKEIQKAANKLYGVQFALSVVQVYVLAYLLFHTTLPALTVALLVWLGFIMPTIAGSSMWNNDSRRIAWSRFLIQSGYQLIFFVAISFILG